MCVVRDKRLLKNKLVSLNGQQETLVPASRCVRLACLALLPVVLQEPR